VAASGAEFVVPMSTVVIDDADYVIGTDEKNRVVVVVHPKGIDEKAKGI